MAITTNIKNYSKPHNASGSGGVAAGFVNTGTDINCNSITAALGQIDTLTGGSLSFNDGQFIYLGANEGNILKLTGEELKYAIGQIDDFTANKIKAGSIEAEEISATKGWIETLNSKYITTEYLTVTKQAHFFELVIDKVRSVGGTLLMTQANCIIDYAKAIDNQGNYLAHLDDQNAVAYDVFWLAKDANNRNVTNDWVEGDQAYCQSFNNVSAGVNYDVSNKYYWRLVKSVLVDRYMNLNNGKELPLEQAQQASVNSVYIDRPRIIYTLDVEGVPTEFTEDKGWNTVAQTIQGVITGAGWSQHSGGTADPEQKTQGKMTSTNTVFGIQMTPIANTNLTISSPGKFVVDLLNEDWDATKSRQGARLNIGIYFTDSTSMWFPAPENPQTHYEYVLNADAVIEAVVITNADEVEWKLVHGIRLSNNRADNECDEMLVGSASIPSAGDNLAQLGYRWSGEQDPNEKSRGNAIIIAAYKTPDNGFVHGPQAPQSDPPSKDPIKPPSYAQYEAIGSNSNHRFDLGYYRKTYMDATGSKFYGDFYASGNDSMSLEEMIEDIESESRDIFWAYSHTDNSSIAPSQPDGTTWSKTTVAGVSWEYMGTCSAVVTPTGSETYQQAYARVNASLIFTDYNWIVIPGGSGTPGGNWVYCYKNTQDAYVAPNPPNVNGVAKTLEELPYNGWYSTPQTLPQGYYTWESQAFIYGSGTYSLWQTAVRITGADGKDGEDGNDIEFIYYRNNGDQDGDPMTPPVPPNGHTYRDDWPSTYDQYGQKTSDHETIYVNNVPYTWYDNPQGVGNYPEDPNAYLYEYMCQRIKRNGEWSDYSNPVVWSNWGKKGQDGDGYEYIFKLYAQEQSSWAASGDTNPANWNEYSGVDSRGNYFEDDEYLGPIAQGWSDDPQDLSQSFGFEYCAVRKKVNGEWQSFSTPALWAHWADPGSQGPPGPQGPQGPGGADASGYVLLDWGSKALYGLTLNQTNDIEANFNIVLRFKVCRAAGENVTPMTYNELQTAGLSVYVRYGLKQNGSFVYKWHKFTTVDQTDNTLLEYDFTPPSGWNANDIEEFCNYNQSFVIGLIPSTNNELADNATAVSSMKQNIYIPLVLNTGAALGIVQRDKNNNASIAALVTNTTENTNNINYLYSGVQGVQSSVTSLYNGMQGMQSGMQGMQSQINQQASQISLTVTGLQGLQGAIVNTGIDIGHQRIDLYADKVNFYGNQGVQGAQGKIWIDGNQGTLHAVDGEFSGKLTAENSSGNKIIIDPVDPSIKGWESGYQSTYGNPAFEIKTVGYTTGNAASMEMRGPQTHGVFEGSRLQVEDTSNGQSFIHLEAGNDIYRPMIIIQGINNVQLQIGLYRPYDPVTRTYLNTHKIFIKPSNNAMWPTQEEAVNGSVWLDDGYYLRVKDNY